MSIFQISLMAAGFILTAVYVLFWAESSFKVSRVFYNDDGVELPGLLVQRPFRRPVFFPFEAACGFDSQIIYMENEALIRPMGVVDIAGGSDTHILCLPNTIASAEEAKAPQTKGVPIMLDPKEIAIHKDGISRILKMRWIACYMLYDWNKWHADFAFGSNEFERYQWVCRKLEDKVPDAASMASVLTDTYNQVLLEDVDGFIHTHMQVWNCERLMVEMEIVRALAELYHTNEV